MANFLVGHAYRHVWCDPAMDFTHIFMPARISPVTGSLANVDVLWRTYALPTSTDLYQVYQVGHVEPESLGLEAVTDTWLPLSQVMMDRLVVINVYTTNGIMLPLATSYLMYTSDRTLVLAVKMWPTIADLTSVDCFFRFYSNAFFTSRRSALQRNVVVSQFYQHQGVQSAALAFQNAMNGYQQLPGFVVLYKNGRYIGYLNALTLQAGDLLEFVYDSSVKKVVDFPISTLSTFESTKDLMTKYMLHYDGPQPTPPGTNEPAVQIDYRDDIDVYLTLPSTLSGGIPTWDGIYYHKNNDNAFRQVTHRDYSVNVPYVVTYQSSNPSWTNLALLNLRLVIRNAGFDRPLVYDVNRIQDLYRMSDTQIAEAFTGIDSTLSYWQAAVLEDSDYIDIMDATQSTISLDTVEGAYGYYAIGNLVASSPKLMDGASWISLPPGLRQNATMYEYDVNGQLLGWYPHTLGPEYSPVYTGCKLVEGRITPGAMLISQTMGQTNVPIQAGYSYRFYIAPVNGGVVQTGQWQDVTGDNTKYMIVNGQVNWLVDTEAYQTVVKSDAQHLIYQVSINPPDGIFAFSIQATVSYPSGLVTEVLTIPVGQLDLWLNGHALIENVDYYVTWPQVVIVNKKFLNQSGPQVITVRGTGFCNSDLSRTPAMETEFVRFGVLSHNGVYNIHSGRVTRIVANGAVWAPSQVLFAEDQIQGVIPGLPNGSPYAITQVVVPTGNYTDQDTYVMMAADAAIDVATCAYLTEQLPDSYPTTPDIIPGLYDVFSPFANAVVQDMVRGVISMTNFQGQYSDRDIKNALAAYMYLLPYDPTQKDVDLSHIAIHPHDSYEVINLSVYQYNFLSRANVLLLNGEVDLSKFLTFTWYQTQSA